jgi:FlaA1/EpsC-like NDP-sugar epimerase
LANKKELSLLARLRVGDKIIMTFYKDKQVLVTGGTGLIGRPLVEMLLEQGAKVTVVVSKKSQHCRPSL